MKTILEWAVVAVGIVFIVVLAVLALAPFENPIWTVPQWVARCIGVLIFGFWAGQRWMGKKVEEMIDKKL